MNPFETNAHDPNNFPAPSQMMPSLMVPDAAALTEDDEVADWGDDFSFDHFQVVRAEFFANLRVPSATFNQNKLYVNSACLAKFPNTSFVIPSIDKDSKLLALLPSSEIIREAQMWCRTDPKGKRVPRRMSCPLMSEMVFAMMGWNKDTRYKLLGQLVHAHGITFIAFDLKNHGAYSRNTDDKGVSTVSRTPTYPESWKDSFGPTVEEHQKALQLSFFGDYVMFSVEDSSHKNEPVPAQEEQPHPQVLGANMEGGNILDPQQ